MKNLSWQVVSCCKKITSFFSFFVEFFFQLIFLYIFPIRKYKKEYLTEINFLRQIMPVCQMSLLDTDCRNGDFLEFSQKYFYQVFGIDIDKNNVDYCRKKSLNVFRGKIELNRFSKNCFDVIRVDDILNLSEDTHNKIIKIKSMLKKNGYLIIHIPSGNLLYKIKRLFIDFLFQKDTERAISIFNKDLQNDIENVHKFKLLGQIKMNDIVEIYFK